MGLISRVSSRTYRKMPESYVTKNKIRLQLRKTRQRVIKNLKRDLSKGDAEKTELLEQVRKANIETVLKFVLGKPGTIEKPDGEQKIGLVFMKSKHRTLLDELESNLESFRANRPTEKRRKVTKPEKDTVATVRKVEKAVVTEDFAVEEAAESSESEDDFFLGSGGSSPKKAKIEVEQIVVK